MKFKKKPIESEIFTGSMADISFLLIIYFMITSAFSATRGLDFALPEDTQTPEIKQEDAIDVHVLRGGAILPLGVEQKKLAQLGVARLAVSYVVLRLVRLT